MEEHRPNDDLFKKLLENHPEFETDPAALEDMRRRLEETDQPRRKGGGVWWLPFLVLPFLIGTIVLFFQNRNLNTQINQLQTQINIDKNDTLEHKYITYHYDTIYNTIYKDKVVTRTIYKNQIDDLTIPNTKVLNYYDNKFRSLVSFSSADYFVGKRNPFRYLSNSSDGYNNTFTSLQQFNYSQNKNQINSESGNNAARNLTSNAAVSIPTLMSFLEEKKRENILFDLEEATSGFKKWRKAPSHYLTPKSFRIGVEGSPISFIDIDGDQAFKPMYSYGIASEIGFSDQFRMTLGVRKADLKFELKDPVLMAQYPAVLPSDPSDFVREMYVIINHLQIPISFKYLFSKRKKWNTFIRAGLVASRSIRQRFKYNLITTSFQQYNSELTFNEGSFSIKNFESAFGLEYNISSKWVASSQFFYLHDFELNAGEYFQLQSLGLNFGLKYKL